MKVRNFRELMNGHASAEIRCLYTGKLVRKLTLISENNLVCVSIDACDGDKPLVVPDTTPISYEPWVFDRGNMTFEAPEGGRFPTGTTLKICGEGDPITFGNGAKSTVEP